MSTKRTGRQILLNFSIPPFTPKATTTMLAPRKRVWNRSGAQVEETSVPNIPPMASGDSLIKLKDKDLNK